MKNEQLQSLIIQKETFKLKLREVEDTIKELERTKDEFVYKLVGNVLVKKNKNEIVKELKSLKEALEIKIKQLEEMQKKLKVNKNEKK